jgi:hypothetical protein
MKPKKLTRRNFLRLSAFTAAGAVLAGCKPQVIEKTVEVPVKETVEVPVEQTVVVEVTSAPPPVEEKVSLSFWNMPFVTQEVSPEYVLQWEKDGHCSIVVLAHLAGKNALCKQEKQL